MRKIVVLGGGRWAKTMVLVLSEKLKQNGEITWLSEFQYQNISDWLSKTKIQNVKAFRSSKIENINCNGIIIANASAKHADSIRSAIALGVPVLSEKPLTTNYPDLDSIIELAKNAGVPLGIHLEFLLAEFMDTFRAMVIGRKISKILIEWKDPWEEQRIDEVKRPDWFTDLVLDMMPHTLSVLSRLNLVDSDLKLLGCEYLGSEGIKILLNQGGVDIELLMGRRHSRRVRKITIDEALHYDFSIEPGLIDEDGVQQNLNWSGQRPLSQSLESFMRVLDNPSSFSSWVLSTERNRYILELSHLAAISVFKLQESALGKIEHGKPNSPSSEALIVDHFIPLLANRGIRWPLISKESHGTFAEKLWLNGMDINQLLKSYNP